MRRCVVLLGAILVFAPTGSVAQGADTPSAAGDLLLSAGDFAGKAKVLRNRIYTTSGSRLYGPGLRLGSARFLGVYSGAGVYTTVDSADAYFKEQVRALTRRSGREKTLRNWGESLFGKGTFKRYVSGPMTKIGADGAQVIGTAVSSRETIRFGLGIVRVDRAVSVVVLVGLYGGELSTATMRRGMTIARENLRAAFTIDVITPPAITRSARVPTLSVEKGAWTGWPYGFAYAWSRCDVSGTTCVETGVTTPWYRLGADDVGSAFQVTVTASNTLGERTVTSAVSEPVTKL